MGNCCTNEMKVKTEWFPSFEAQVPELGGKRVVITGTTSGTGLVAARTCLKKGAEVIMLNRSSERSEKALKRLQAEVPGGKLQQVACDLMDFASVREAAQTVLSMSAEGGLDVLCCNAGIMDFPDTATKDGFDVQMQTNHLSHFLLSKELLPALQTAAKEKGEARIVNHSSVLRKGKPLDGKFLGKNGGQLGGNQQGLERYHQTKLANILFTFALEARLATSGNGNIKALCCTPGVSTTNLGSSGEASGGGKWRLVKLFSCCTALNVQSEEDGTMPLLTAIGATDAQSGDFITPSLGMFGETRGPTKTQRRPLGDAICQDVAAQEVLWTESEKAIGEAFKI